MEYKNLNALPRLLKKLPFSLVNPLVNHINQVLDIFYNYQSFSKFHKKNVDFYLNKSYVSPQAIKQQLQQEPFIIIDREYKNKLLTVNQLVNLPLNECQESQNRLISKSQNQHQKKKNNNNTNSQPNLSTSSTKQKNIIKSSQKERNKLRLQEDKDKSLNQQPMENNNLRAHKIIFEESNFPVLEEDHNPQQFIPIPQLIHEEKNNDKLEGENQISPKEDKPKKKSFQERKLAYKAIQRVISELAAKRNKPQLKKDPPQEKIKSQAIEENSSKMINQQFILKNDDTQLNQNPPPANKQSQDIEQNSIDKQLSQIKAEINQVIEKSQSQAIEKNLINYQSAQVKTAINQITNKNQSQDIRGGLKDNQSAQVNTKINQAIERNQSETDNQYRPSIKNQLPKQKSILQINQSISQNPQLKYESILEQFIDNDQQQEKIQGITQLATQLPKLENIENDECKYIMSIYQNVNQINLLQEKDNQTQSIEQNLKKLKQANQQPSKSMISIVPQNGVYSSQFLKQQQAFEALCVPMKENKDQNYQQLILVDQEGKESLLDTKVFSKLIIPYKEIELDFNTTANQIQTLMIQIGRITYLYPGNMIQEMNSKMTEQLHLAQETKRNLQKKFVKFPILTLETAHKLKKQYYGQLSELLKNGLDKAKLREAGIRELKLKEDVACSTFNEIPTNVEINRDETTTFHIELMYRSYLDGKLPNQEEPVPIKTKDKKSKINLKNLEMALTSYMNIVVNKFFRYEYFRDQEIRISTMSRFKERYSIINFNIIQKYNNLEIVPEECIVKEIQIYNQFLELADIVDFMLEYTEDKIPLEVIQQWVIDEGNQ